MSNSPESSNTDQSDRGVTLSRDTPLNIWIDLLTGWESGDRLASIVMSRLFHSVLTDYITNRVYTDDDYARTIALRIQKITNDVG